MSGTRRDFLKRQAMQPGSSYSCVEVSNDSDDPAVRREELRRIAESNPGCLVVVQSDEDDSFFDDIEPWNVAKRDAFVVHNPYATLPFPPGQLGVPERCYAGRDELARTDGKRIGELLGLPQEGPG